MSLELTEGRFSVRISRATLSHGPDEYRIRVIDKASRLPVVELALNATQFAEAVTGLNADDVAGEILVTAQRGHLGKQMDHYSVSFRASEESAREWAETARHYLGADTFELTRTQRGKQVTFRWYRPVGSPPIDHLVAASLLPPLPTL
jgi:hypothetical protein